MSTQKVINMVTIVTQKSAVYLHQQYQHEMVNNRWIYVGNEMDFNNVLDLYKKQWGKFPLEYKCIATAILKIHFGQIKVIKLPLFVSLSIH